MKPIVFVVILILVQLCWAWEKLDHEIFELYDDIKRNEPTADWYELLKISPKSTVDEINRSYRQLSKKYHPDKLNRLGSERGAVEEKRFQRIGLVVNILRNKESRKRYNFFRKNGVPVWRGTGYLYRRWRPGFITVVFGLLLFVSAMQYLFHHLSYWRAQQRIKDIELQQDGFGGNPSVARDTETKQPPRRIRRRQKANGSTPSNNPEDDSGFEGEDNNESQFNTVGVINPYTVQPAAFGRLLIARLPVILATSALSLVGLRTSNTADVLSEDEADVEEFDASEETHHDAVAAAIQNIDSPADVAAKSEAKAKKASKKAAKADARRRRTPIVS
ncbi:chaperone J-domain-containing protein [Coemansia reversa NRRL 1564]|uniref:Chaperone J-domain-containing protein n=1 Tax=Coemansia reversa (strain ATCC 12441 / NRRL 1564) TaxID=763665 RepID=A0A2G5B958_COERN|nr:chaperone J-domain-containing protein [Coemansia reversa NRRL 1564]|eukprot:PIA15549.1 chaperone J-domain-containing protein [Coemansia reversa NRRL 1564]